MKLLELIDIYLNQKTSRDMTSHYPSQINECNRKMYWRWKKEPVTNPIDSASLMKMEIGNRIHEFVAEALAGAGLEVLSEIEFKHKHPELEKQISGRIDNVFIDTDKQMCGIEIKSISGYGVTDIIKNGPKSEHLSQIGVYLNCTDLKRFYLIYIARDKAFRAQFLVEKKDDGVYLDNKKTDFDLNKLIAKCKAVELSLKSDIIPEREYIVAIKNGEIRDDFQKNSEKIKSCWQCLYCSYKNKCWNQEAEKYIGSDNADEVLAWHGSTRSR